MLNNIHLNQINTSSHMRNKNLDIFKAFLIILVVIRHILQYSVIDEGGILTNIIWAIQMPGFMLVAGYLSVREINNCKELIKRIIISVQHYALPFFSWFLIIDVLILGSYSHNPISGLAYLMFHIDTGLWFLWVLFILSIVFSFINYMLSSGKKRILRAFIVSFFILLLFLLTAFYFGFSFIGLKYVLYYSVFYGFGWLINLTKNIWIKVWSKIEPIVVFICLVVFLFIVFHIDLYHLDDSVSSIFIRCISAFSGNGILYSICKHHAILFHKLRFDFIGMYTLEIYVSHVYVNNLFEIGENFFTISGFTNFCCSMVITIVFTLVIVLSFKSNCITNFIFYGKRR